MNVWTDIALANLQRTRGLPLDLLEEDVPTKVCNNCLEEKPETAFYLKNRPDGTTYRRGTCKQCDCERERKLRGRKPRPLPARERCYAILSTKGPLSVAELSVYMSAARRSVARMLHELTESGRVVQWAITGNKFNPRIPVYWVFRHDKTTPAAPAERNSA